MELTQEIPKKVRLDEISCSDQGNKKLSQCISGLRYDVELDPNLEDLSLKGVCKLQFRAVDEFEHFYVHMKGLTVESITTFCHDQTYETEC